ncbi:hypothetical protein HC028_03410 [Planosporangium flavigriseum]|uniref:Uncharacterized protein n=1 Tax=Planosporangium flavigriseum TaxID=373681 RepID=A0A8J3LRB6_9ACTN|nr:hypothetical protein [Planosporangium flavigriseum]NJC63563.1 hypothetical protein [Planosporangium flavigriseum]GIG72261.1 hypothetical protein Pfl04_06650 [Planosporangium flavigriseum]
MAVEEYLGREDALDGRRAQVDVTHYRPPSILMPADLPQAGQVSVTPQALHHRVLTLKANRPAAKPAASAEHAAVSSTAISAPG